MAKINARLECVDVLQRAGNLERCEKVAREALDTCGDEHPRHKALAWARVADIQYMRGELDEALRIRREEVLPVFEQLADEVERAITLSKIADVLFVRGEVDEALRILLEDVLPVFERQRDEQGRAVTLGRVADILSARGDLDEALRIRREEELPVYERLEDVRSLLVARTNQAQVLAKRGAPEDHAEIDKLLALALRDARRLRIPEIQKIEKIIRDLGKDPNAPPFV